MTEHDVKCTLDVILKQLYSEHKRIDEVRNYLECIRSNLSYDVYAHVYDVLSNLGDCVTSSFLHIQSYIDCICDTPQQ